MSGRKLIIRRSIQKSSEQNIELKEAKSIDILEGAPIDPKTWVFIFFIY